MASKKKTTVLQEAELRTQYVDYVLEQERKPASVYKFCKSIEIEELQFYAHFASLEALEASFFVALHEHSLKLLQEHPEYFDYDDSNKLLSYYFTFFEMANANRSYILMSLQQQQQPLEALLQLKGLRQQFLLFANELLGHRKLLSEEKFQKIERSVIQEAAWLQFMLCFKFWLSDQSVNFEKTDLLIEKSVRASFDILDHIPMKSLVDLGKFLWKERPFQ